MSGFHDQWMRAWQLTETVEEAHERASLRRLLDIATDLGTDREGKRAALTIVREVCAAVQRGAG